VASAVGLIRKLLRDDLLLQQDIVPVAVSDAICRLALTLASVAFALTELLIKIGGIDGG